MAPCLLSHQTVPQGFVFRVLLIIVDWIKLRVRFVPFALRSKGRRDANMGLLTGRVAK